MMAPRDIKPVVSGFPGLPKWLDDPYIKRQAKEWGVTYEEALARIKRTRK